MQAQNATIVRETVDYIKTLEGTLMGLENVKVERILAELLGAAGSSRIAPLPPPVVPRESTLADMGNNWNTQQTTMVAPPHGPFQTWFVLNIVMNITGNESFIYVCVPKQPGVMTKALCVLDKYHIDVITLNISSDKNNNIFSIHTCVSCLAANIYFPEN
jgi:hypothetical protein